MYTDYRPYPKGIALKTRFGTVTLAVTQADHIYVDANSNSGSDPAVGLTVNNVRLGVSAHVYLWPDGIWRIGSPDASGYDQRQSLHASRADWTNYSKSHASESARGKLTAELEAVVNAWAAENGAVLAAGESAHRHNETDRRRGEIAKLREQIAALEAEIASLS